MLQRPHCISINARSRAGCITSAQTHFVYWKVDSRFPLSSAQLVQRSPVQRCKVEIIVVLARKRLGGHFQSIQFRAALPLSASVVAAQPALPAASRNLIRNASRVHSHGVRRSCRPLFRLQTPRATAAAIGGLLIRHRYRSILRDSRTTGDRSHTQSADARQSQVFLASEQTLAWQLTGECPFDSTRKLE